MDNRMNAYQNYIYKSRYARYLDDKQRRENWDETVDRYIDFFKAKINNEDIPWTKLRKAILNMEVMPSMRALMTAGPALERDNVAGYNCAYVAVDNMRVFDEIMYVLMCGTGVGFSVERQYINKLPEVADEFHDTDTIINVKDSKIGWASAYRSLISELYGGHIPKWDTSRVRRRGSRLLTFGGRASGPEPLEDLFRFTIRIFRAAAGRKLNSLEVHDIICKIADVVVCGGVRRSALLSLSNLTDQRMRNAKTGDWYYAEPQRALANNSVAYTERPDIGIFMDEWLSLYRSKSGERGIFNRDACNNLLPARREPNDDFGTNPCSEIVLRSKQFCNLTEVIIRPEDDLNVLLRKVEFATILGTIQSTLTDFRYLSNTWKRNTEEERLLGVSLTGIMDHVQLSYPSGICVEWLKELKNHAIKVNKKYSTVLGIPPSAAITCVKPSGTVSQLCGTSSGIHPNYSPYYIRRVRADTNDPLCKALKDAGVPWEVSRTNANELVFAFPKKCADDAVCIADCEPIRQLELWYCYATIWCEHKPSVSIYVKEREWLSVAAWVYDHWDAMSGVSFFPFDDHVYPQAPYEAITKEEYDKLMETFPKELDLDNVVEVEDTTTGSQELACAGGACEL